VSAKYEGLEPRLQLEMAARGCVSGQLTEWPALISAIQWALEHIDCLTVKNAQLQDGLTALSRPAALNYITALEGEVAELRQDRDRIDWLETVIGVDCISTTFTPLKDEPSDNVDPAFNLGERFDYSGPLRFSYRIPGKTTLVDVCSIEANTLREALDAARKQSGTK
jgi:hypothetical protein